MLRIGFGNDIHRLASDKPLVLGGVRIPAAKGAVGHSDADALTHAITDAILGALAIGDIGSYFSDQDERWNKADSLIFLAEAVAMMKDKGFSLVNLDSTITLETPKLRPYIDEIRGRLSKVLEIDQSFISVKAKTNEKLGAIGEHLAIKAEAIVLIKSES